MHVSPPDVPGHSKYDVAAALDRARAMELDFVVFAPHGADRAFPAPDASGAPGATIDGQALTERAIRAALAAPPPPGPDGTPGPAPRPIVAVAGWEYTRPWPGHLTLAFFSMPAVAALDGDRKAEEVVRGGGLAVVNHPFFRIVKMSPLLERAVAARGLEGGGDWRWKPFFGEGTDPLSWNAIEVWHERSALVENLHASEAAKYPETRMVRDALAAWDRSVRERRRRIVAVGGSDCHGRPPYATVPLRVVGVGVETSGGTQSGGAAFDAEGLRRGLVAARVTFGRNGGLAARDFAATSDVEGERAGVGGSVRARREVRLTWEGRARLVEDGADVGEFEGGAVRRVDPPGSFHAWRIEKPDDAYSNMIHANLPR